MTRHYRDHAFDTSDGLRLYARLYGGADDRTPLLCLHGLTRNSADFHDLLSRLPDWPAISVDQRGRGRSAHDSDPSNYRPDIYCDDTLALLDGLEVARVIAVGTSMGGLMTFMLAHRRPALIRAAIINDIGPDIDPAGLERLANYVGAAMSFDGWDEAIAAIQAQGPDIYPDFTPDQWQAFAENLCEPLEGGRVGFRYDPAIALRLKDRDPTAVPPDLWPLFTAPSDFPMLILRGETSDILSSETAQRMVAARANARLVTVPGRGHAPTLTEPVALAAIRSFLEMQS